MFIHSVEQKGIVCAKNRNLKIDWKISLSPNSQSYKTYVVGTAYAKDITKTKVAQKSTSYALRVQFIYIEARALIKMNLKVSHHHNKTINSI